MNMVHIPAASVMPRITMTVARKNIKFLVDSGAEISVIQKKEFGENPPKMSGRYMHALVLKQGLHSPTV